MNILIIEDEPRIVRDLSTMLLKINSSINIMDKLDSIESTINYFKVNPQPDLIFSDIHLADGLSFEIFDKVNITCPIVFLTAYDQYAIEAFKVNSIDYILKPFTRDSIEKSLNKYLQITEHFSNKKEFKINTEDILKALNNSRSKSTLLISSAGKYVPVLIKDIAYFFIENGIVFIYTFNGKKFNTPFTLDEVENKLNEKEFYRANRRFIINFNSIYEIKHFFNRKLIVKLNVPVKEDIIISREKSAAFIEWMEIH